MKLRLFRHLWGLTAPHEEIFPKIKAEGYDGIESSLRAANANPRFQENLKQHEFEYIPQIFTSGSTVEEHVGSFEEQIEAAKIFKPRLINCHSGKDSWTFEQSVRFFRRVLDIEEREGVVVAHETHRGRIFFNPWACSRLLSRFDNLKLCCDFSHWVCVCERLVDDELEIISQCAERCVHIHARVGHEEGPQVSDPRAPEYAAHVEGHERWWDMVWDSQESRGLEVSTLTPEFGPPPYMPTLPYTGTPLVDLWDICTYMAKRQARRFAMRGSRGGEK